MANKYGWEDVFANRPIGVTWWCFLVLVAIMQINVVVFPALGPSWHLGGWVSTAIAQALNPPPDQNAQNDVRPQHWLEVSKNGDVWVLCKDGLLAWKM